MKLKLVFLFMIFINGCAFLQGQPFGITKAEYPMSKVDVEKNIDVPEKDLSKHKEVVPSNIFSPGKNWKLVWSEEFNYVGLPDSSKWNFETGGHGWGNNEKQFYTRADTMNAMVRNGVLAITARKEQHGNNTYTSTRLTTKGKSEWTYGRIEVRAKLPGGIGLWPAIWMLAGDINTVRWPLCGEIDIMEHVGYKKDSVFSTVHTQAYNHIKNTQKGKDIFIEKPYSQFHVFAMEWTPDGIDFFMDGQLYNHFANEHKTAEEWPFDKPFFLILNVAVGGNLGGKEGINDAAFPATMEVDYVRVFQ